MLKYCTLSTHIQDIRKEFESIELQWAKKLEEKENEIENLKKTRFLNTMAPEEKGVSGWKEIEVVQWINYNLPVSLCFRAISIDNRIHDSCKDLLNMLGHVKI